MSPEVVLSPEIQDQVSQRLLVAKTLVEEAGLKALQMQAGHLDVIQKKEGIADIVTNADIEVQRLVIEGIQNFGDNIRSEEQKTDIRVHNSRFEWVIDDIDGTLPFTFQGLEWGISLGLHHEGKPVAGVIAFPALDRMYTTITGEGTFCNGQKITTKTIPTIEGKPFYFNYKYLKGDPSVVDEHISPFFKALVEKKVAYIYAPPCITWGICQVANGIMAPAILNTNVTPFDLGAASLILTEAGGVHSKIDWQRERQPFLATANQRIFDEAWSMFEEANLIKKIGLKR